MIRKLIIVAALLALNTPAFADQERPRLKAEATVTGNVVRIGDLVAHAGIIANVPIFRAPDLGATGTVPAEAVVDRGAMEAAASGSCGAAIRETSALAVVSSAIERMAAR